MNKENNNLEMTEESGFDDAESMMEKGAEVCEKAMDAVHDAYDKTVEKVSSTCERAKDYSYEHPGKTVLIALGVGVAVGLLLGAKTHRSRSSRIAGPMVNALSDIALAFFR